MSAPKLKNCPFCGSLPEYEPWHGGLPTKMMIMCGNRPDGSGGDCMVGPMVTGETMDEAAENWNRRTDLSQASVAAALEAAANVMGERQALISREQVADLIRALISPAQHDALAAHVAKARAEDAAWQPIDTCPLGKDVDLWCVYGGEEFAQYDGGASIGKLVSDRRKSAEYGWFGNQSNDGVPQGSDKDLIPVAWRFAVPHCPSDLIAKVLGIPLTREDALAQIGSKP